MVKGVTRRVVEIKETGSDYFERAIFFINIDGSRGTNENTLSQEARRIIDNLSHEDTPCSEDKMQRIKKRAISVLKLLISAGVGVFATLIFTQVF
ncbi:hypothetical protein CCDG5_0492 [[Clostridium] cellulosi]|uniref:Uncharacterized protein n=1 Tax=[Clostridium] cellulosi TaxID=29343 RepID=A0A078KR49_9FIRM|nr:MAG: hypothetical protein DIU81_02765 [[Clostridium] cellulosi]CDZ23630.1 hypothetical protein CCDG5_0492 [[Clostridium] cellulosi]